MFFLTCSFLLRPKPSCPCPRPDKISVTTNLEFTVCGLSMTPCQILRDQGSSGSVAFAFTFYFWFLQYQSSQFSFAFFSTRYQLWFVIFLQMSLTSLEAQRSSDLFLIKDFRLSLAELVYFFTDNLWGVEPILLEKFGLQTEPDFLFSGIQSLDLDGYIRGPEPVPLRLYFYCNAVGNLPLITLSVTETIRRINFALRTYLSLNTAIATGHPRWYYQFLMSSSEFAHKSCVVCLPVTYCTQFRVRLGIACAW